MTDRLIAGGKGKLFSGIAIRLITGTGFFPSSWRSEGSREIADADTAAIFQRISSSGGFFLPPLWIVYGVNV